ncbi:hypothetical protein ASPFODRAFT_55129 [Aspergillus luchuensis CBS 106.47]|uniref:Uncharacterized protein n=1 Tax=Aspergillus luchuensis (strain CBS 106.47) TaxID=1137211 RepID=A0A1M3SYB6_ASPLC|nr:hypothetical protein ASPFODRAFT_55129 [Aspergillus luchuensis CBS 106.47]
MKIAIYSQNRADLNSGRTSLVKDSSSRRCNSGLVPLVPSQPGMRNVPFPSPSPADIHSDSIPLYRAERRDLV